jgi:hypothetical protein
LVVHGEWGVGKTALLEYAAEAGGEFRITPTSGVEAAMEPLLGSAAGYMPELNVLRGLADVSSQSDQPVTKHLVVEIAASRPAADSEAAS